MLAAAEAPAQAKDSELPVLQDRKPSPLEKGGSLKGEKAAGKVKAVFATGRRLVSFLHTTLGVLGGLAGCSFEDLT